jgi:DNA replication and repair protein RecF
MLLKNLKILSPLLPGELSVALRQGGVSPGEDFLDSFIKKLDNYREEERRLGFPSVGPHRDDLSIEVDGLAAARRLSRGQRRRLAVALVVASGYAVQEHLGRSPLLLLDEVAAELDPSGKGLLFSSLEETSWQVVATTAEEGFDGWPGRTLRLSEGSLCPRDD